MLVRPQFDGEPAQRLAAHRLQPGNEAFAAQAVYAAGQTQTFNYQLGGQVALHAGKIGVHVASGLFCGFDKLTGNGA